MPAPKDRIEPLLVFWEPKLRDAFLAAVNGIRNRVVLAKLTEMIKVGDVEGAIRAAGLDPISFRPLSAMIEQAYEAGGADAIAGVRPTRGPLGLQISPLFDIRTPTADYWIRQHSAALVRQITEDQRTLIREAMAPLSSGADPMMSGQTPQKIALDLVGRINRITGNREGGIIGLTSQQATWARNYEIELGDVQAGVAPSPNALTRQWRDARFDKTVARAIRDGQPISAETRRAMVANYRNRALQYRGNLIAGHETLTALHESQLEAWDQAIARGAVAEDKVRRFWVTAGDERVRPEHRLIPGMNKGGVGLRQMFDTPDGPRNYPPIDPGCRCRVRVRVVD